MNLDRLGELSFLHLHNGRLFTELGQDVTDELLGLFEEAVLASDSVTCTESQRSARLDLVDSQPHTPVPHERSDVKTRRVKTGCCHDREASQSDTD